MLSRGDTVFTDSNLSDWLVAREDKTDDENYEEVEAKPQPQKKRIEPALNAEHTDRGPPQNDSKANRIKNFTTCH